MDTLHSAARLRRKSLVLGLGAALALAGGPLTGAVEPGPAGAFAGGRAFGLPAPAASPSWRERVRTRGAAEPARGVLVSVTNCNDSGPGSLRDAIDSAPEAALVDLSALACSTITLATGEIEVPQKRLSIQGPGRDALTIDAGGAGRAFYMRQKYDSGDPAAIWLGDLTIANGHSPTAGGCISALGTVHLEDVRIRDCKAENPTDVASGGAIFAFGHVRMTDSIVTGNTASGANGANGGAIMSAKYAELMDTTIEGNVASSASGMAYGGAIDAGGVYMIGGHIRHNTARASDGIAFGGGIATRGATDTGGSPVFAYMVYSSLVGNLAEGSTGAYGGGIQGGSATGTDPAFANVLFYAGTISGNRATSACASCDVAGGGMNVVGIGQLGFSTVRDNVAELTAPSAGTASGGGLANAPQLAVPIGGLQLFRSTISGNRATSATGRAAGGGVAGSNYGVYLELSTIAANRASLAGGGLHMAVPGTTRWLSGMIVAGNQAPLGADIGAQVAVTFSGQSNIVMNPDPIVTLPADTLTTDPKLLPLANYGGPTATHALAACSPAIDAIPVGPLALTGGLDSDQRLAPYLAVYGPGMDIGAFEVQPDADLVFRDFFEASPCP